MSSGVLKRIPANDGAMNSCMAKSSSSKDEAESWRKVLWTTANEVADDLKRSSSTDDGYGGECTSMSPFSNGNSGGESVSDGSVCESKYSPCGEGSSRSWTLPTNIVYGPHDIVSSPQHLHCPHSKEDNCNLEKLETSLERGTHSKDTASSSSDASWTPLKRSQMKRSHSMDDDYSHTRVRDEECAVKRSPPANIETVFKEEVEKVSSNEDVRIVSWGHCQTVKRSSSIDDDQRTNGAQSTSTEEAERMLHTIARPIKRSPSADKDSSDYKTVDAYLVNGLASKDEEVSAAKVKRSLSVDGVEEPLTKSDFKDEYYYNTGLAKHSQTSPLNQNPRKDGLSPSKPCASKTQECRKVKRSQSIDGTKSSTSSAVSSHLLHRSRSLDSPGTVTWVSPKETPNPAKKVSSKVPDFKLKTSTHVDAIENVKKVTWAVPTKAPRVKRSLRIVDNHSPCKVKRSVSADCAGGSKNMTWVPKSILKETVFKGDYYKTGMVKRSRSIDVMKGCTNVPGKADITKTSTAESINPFKGYPLLKESAPVSLKSKNVTWSLPKDHRPSRDKKSLPKQNNTGPRRMTRSALKEIGADTKKEVDVRPPAKYESSKIEANLSKKRVGTLNRVKRTVPVGKTSTAKELKRNVPTKSLKKQSLIRKGVNESVASNEEQEKILSSSGVQPNAPTSLELKRSDSTDIVEEKSNEPTTAERIASSTENGMTLNIITDKSKDEVVEGVPGDNLNPSELKRTESTDAMKENGSPDGEYTANVLNSSELKRTPSSDAMKETKVPSNPTPKSRKSKRSPTKDNDITSNVPEPKENPETLSGNKRKSPKESTRCLSKIKRSHSKDDASSSKRDSGISLSDSPSDNEHEIIDPSSKMNRHCAICSKSFKGITDLRRHLLIHSDEKPHVCHICNKAYRQNVNLKNHMKVEHSKEKDFVCQFCMKPFPLKNRLKLHLRVHIGEKPHICPHCPKTFARAGQLQQHLKTHDGSVKDNCGVSTSPKLHKDREDYVCQICNTSFETERAMRSHMSTAHGCLKNFECQICERKIEDDLDTHMKTHAVARPHECEICKATFAQKTQYNIHMRTHTGERPYQCMVCWQSFGHTNVLKLHIRKHTGEKPFKCVLCKEVYIAFSQLSHLKTHMKTIHKEEGAYICEGCKMCFKIKFHLENHVKNCDKFQTISTTLTIGEQKAIEKDAELLTHLRYLISVLLRKISTPEKLAMLGFEKRLVDNVLIASLKLADQKAYDSKTINELDRMKLNIEAFLEWIVPQTVMDGFKKECPSIESILEKIVSMYLKRVG